MLNLFVSIVEEEEIVRSQIKLKTINIYKNFYIEKYDTFALQ